MITRVLRNRFIFGPSLLSSAIKPFNGLEHRFAFHKLAEEYLPGEGLSHLTGAGAVKKFAALFSAKYFPIAVGTYSTEMKDLIRGIPARWHGMSRFGYEGYLVPDAQMLASALCVSPVTAGARIVMMEKFAQKGGAPLDGWGLEDVLDALVKYPGLQDWCRWIFGRTGNFWLDKTETLPWNRKTVDRLTVDWPLYLEADKRMKDFNIWLGKDFKKRCAEVIAHVKKERSKRLTEILK